MQHIVRMMTVCVLAATPVFAQEHRGYVTGAGGFASSADGTSGDVLGEAGMRIAPHVSVFANVGRFENLQPSAVQPAVDLTVAAFGVGTGLNLTGTGTVPAWYSTAGLRYAFPAHGRLTPFASGGLGFAHLTPKASFQYISGTFPDGSLSTSGSAVTSQVIATGVFTEPPSSSAFMWSVGAGADFQLVRHVALEAGYRFSRVAADTPIDANSVTFGMGYRF